MVIHLHVVPEEVAVGAHVGEQAADQRRQVDHVGGPVLLEYGLGLGLAANVITNITNTNNTISDVT